MNNKKFKVGNRVRIIDTYLIDSCELNKMGVIVEVRGSNYSTYVVDMGRPRRKRDGDTCWYLRESMIELVRKKNEQLLFDFMY